MAVRIPPARLEGAGTTRLFRRIPRWPKFNFPRPRVVICNPRKMALGGSNLTKLMGVLDYHQPGAALPTFWVVALQPSPKARPTMSKILARDPAMPCKVLCISSPSTSTHLCSLLAETSHSVMSFCYTSLPPRRLQLALGRR
jgi:hypothetical protein